MGSRWPTEAEIYRIERRSSSVIDAPNPIADAPPTHGVLKFFTGYDESLMERLQREFPGAHFVKAFSSLGNRQFVNPQHKAGKPTVWPYSRLFGGTSGRIVAGHSHSVPSPPEFANGIQTASNPMLAWSGDSSKAPLIRPSWQASTLPTAGHWAGQLKCRL